MNGLLKAILLTSLASLSATAESKYYIGVKGINADFSEDVVVSNGKVEVEDGNGFALFAGYQISRNWGFEFDYQNVETESIKYGVALPLDSQLSDTIVFDIDFQSYGAYATYRTGRFFYFKGKAGLFKEEVEAHKDDHKDSGWVVSIGGGYNFSSISVELDYSKFSTDKNVIGLALLYYF